MSSKNDSHGDTINFLVAPFIIIENCRLESIPIGNIKGVDYNTQNASGIFESVMPWPIPIAVPTARRYELLPSPALWKNELENSHISHITCIVLPEDINPKILHYAKKILFNLLANRTLHTRKEIYDEFFMQEDFQIALSAGYRLPVDKKLVEKLLLNNAYCTRHARRINNDRGTAKKRSKKKQISLDDYNCLHVIKNFNVILAAMKNWDKFALGKDIPTYAEIVLAATEEKRQPVAEWLNRQCLDDSQDFAQLWLIIEPKLHR